jgi:MFS family permease
MIMMAVWYGFAIGAYQAYSRSLFAVLIPPGKESAFFAIYELTNRGSSAVGPFVLSVVQETTGDLRWAFVFVLLNISLPAWGLTRLDIAAGARAAEAFREDGDGSSAGKVPAAVSDDDDEQGAVVAATEVELGDGSGTRYRDGSTTSEVAFAPTGGATDDDEGDGQRLAARTNPRAA